MPAIRMILFLAALLVPASASAVTVRDIIELTKAGLSDDILVALIDADRTVFSLDKNEILSLKKAGVSEAVLLKMIRSRRDFDPPAATQEPEMEPVIPVPQPSVPEVVVIGAQPPPPAVTVVVPQYFYVPYSIWGVPRRHPIHAPQPVIAPEYRGFGRFINDGWVNRP
jgi:hypothetical protein